MRRIIPIIVATAAAVLAIVLTAQPAATQGTYGPQGDITGVTAGSGLTGGAVRGEATVDVGAGSGVTVAADAVTIDPTYTQRRISGTCTAPESIRVVNQDGTVTCTSGAGDITSVTMSAPISGGTCSSGACSVGLTPCSEGEILKTSSSAWTCAADDTGGGGGVGDADYGDITVSSSGTVWNIDANTITGTELNLTGTTCSGQFISAIDSNGAGTCTSETGDIAGITTGASSGLTGGCTSGTCSVTMLTTCGSGQVVKWNGSAWACANDDDSGGLSGLTTNTVPKATSSSTIGNSNITDTGTLITLGAAATISGETKVGTNGYVYLGTSNGQIINFGHQVNANSAGWINYYGYSGGTTQFRDLYIGDGKTNAIAFFDGSTLLTTLSGGLTVSGTQTSVVEITASGTATFNGHSNFGNASSDDATFVAQIALDTNSNGIKDSTTAPSISSCGTSPSATSGGNFATTVTVGSGSATSCTVTFADAKGASPTCVVSSRSSTRTDLYLSSVSTSAATVSNTAGANMAGILFDLICVGH